MGKGEGKGKDDDGRNVVLGGCVLMWLIIGCVLLGTSFDTLKPTEVGIRYSDPGNRMLYDEGVWKNGRHCLAPGHSFKKYSTQMKLADFMGGRRLTCWTKDKQEVDVEIGIYYQLDPSGVIDIYKRYGNSYADVWSSMMMQGVKESTKHFDTTDFFDDRSRILTNISGSIISRLSTEPVVNVSLIMGDVRIPVAFETAVTEKVVTQQSEITELMSRNYTLVLADTTLVNADAAKRVKIIEANAKARADVIRAEATAEAEQIKEKAYAESYSYIRETLGLNTTGLMKYIWARSLKEQNGNTKLMVGFDGSTSS